MKLSLQLKLGQQLTMTPQLQQAIKLLQLSTLDLQQEIQEALESNPMLELEEDFDRPGNEGERFVENGPDYDGAGRGDYEAEAQGSSDSAADDYLEGQELNAEEAWNDNAIPVQLSVDSFWDDVYAGASSSGSSNRD